MLFAQADLTLLSDVTTDSTSWMQGGMAGVVGTIAVLLLAKVMPKLHDDERSDRVAVAVAEEEATALIVQQNKEQTERHAKALHEANGAAQVRENVLQLQIIELTKALIQRTANGVHAADG